MTVVRLKFSLCLRNFGSCADTLMGVINGKYMEYKSVPYCKGARRKYIPCIKKDEYLKLCLTTKFYSVKIKSRLRLGNACYHSVQNLLSSRLLSKNLKIRYIEL